MSDETMSLFGADEAAPVSRRREDVHAEPIARRARASPKIPSTTSSSRRPPARARPCVLVSRYVNLLMRGVDPANILAITFTRKAAAEMRERIIRDLRRAAEQSTFDRSRWLDLRDRLGDIQISTIDAFCLSMLREFPLEADLDPNFALADETEVPRLVDQSLDKSLAIFIGLAKTRAGHRAGAAQLGLSRTREGLAAPARPPPGGVGRSRSVPRRGPGRS